MSNKSNEKTINEDKWKDSLPIHWLKILYHQEIVKIKIVKHNSQLVNFAEESWLSPKTLVRIEIESAETICYEVTKSKTIKECRLITGKDLCDGGWFVAKFRWPTMVNHTILNFCPHLGTIPFHECIFQQNISKWI